MSTTYVSAIVAFLMLVLPLFGWQIADEGTMTNLITQIVGGLAVLYTFIGRYKAGGITAFGLKKNN